MHTGTGSNAAQWAGPASILMGFFFFFFLFQKQAFFRLAFGSRRLQETGGRAGSDLSLWVSVSSSDLRVKRLSVLLGSAGQAVETVWVFNKLPSPEEGLGSPPWLCTLGMSFFCRHVSDVGSCHSGTCT